MTQILRYDKDGNAIWIDKSQANIQVEERGSPVPMVKCHALGFPGSQLEAMRADAKLHGHTAIEFRRDPDIPGPNGFYDVYAPDQKSADRYAAHSGFPNQGQNRCVPVSPEELDAARQRTLEQYPVRESA